MASGACPGFTSIGTEWESYRLPALSRRVRAKKLKNDELLSFAGGNPT